MEITNEERREVAQKLRNIERVDFGDGLVCLFYDIDDELGFDWADEDHIFEASVERLIDLIDRPTCSIEHRGGGWFYLSCGHVVPGFKQPRFCPECGAEVIE